MGQIDDAIADVEADDGLSKSQKKRARGDIKQQALIDLVQANLPFTLSLSGKREIEFLTASVSASPTGQCVWTSTGVFTIDTVVRPFDWPWVVVNPPMLVPSNPGQADTTRIVDGETLYFKEDPLAVLKNLADRVFV